MRVSIIINLTGHKQKKRPLGRNVRHGQEAQAATVARSKDTMLLRVILSSLPMSKAFAAPRVELGVVETPSMA
jgi:hypothetical protein